ncbi:MAG: hypothetical protein OXD54_09885 [Candidatus Poribacteria bacterium]|nr:hypothetical protein [Candidatus Poribacteria bacterium]
MLFIFLVIATVTVVFGALIAILYQDRLTEYRIIFGFTAGAVLGFVLMLMVHLFTEVGYFTIIVMWGGFLLIWLLEKFTHRLHARFGNQEEGKKSSIWGVTITIIGLSIHSVMDGVSLSIAAEKQTVGIALAIGVLLHRLPVATVITTALHRDYGIGKTALWLTPLIITPFVGAFIGERLIHSIFKDFANYLFAFALGSLLHVVVDGLKGGCVPSEEKMSNTTKIAFVMGILITFCVMYFIPELGHEHAH